MSEPILELRDVWVNYGERSVLRGIDLQVERGEIVVVLGGSGCGKSTLLKAIVGLTQPHTGQVALFGQDSTHLGPEERAPLLNRIGVLFQHGALLNSLTVSENVALPLEMHTKLSAALIQQIVHTRLQLVGLSHAGQLLPEELSGGMRKRAALARAMVRDPEILFCDEPNAGLDPATAAGIDQLLLTVNRTLGTTLFVVTHELLSIQRLDGRLIMLDAGQVLFTGSVDQAQTSDHPTVHRFFHPEG